jgi:putative transposase
MKQQDVATRQRIAQSHGAGAPARVKEAAHAISVTRYGRRRMRRFCVALIDSESQGKLQIQCKSRKMESSHARAFLLGWRLLRRPRKAMQLPELNHPHIHSVTRALRLKVKIECYAWLNTAAYEVNQVWNWAAEVSEKAARPCTGERKWLTGFDLNNLSAGASGHFGKIGADTIQRVNGEYAEKRRIAKRYRLKWRTSGGPRRSLGWIPFKAASLKRKGRAVRFCGKTFRVFESARLEGVKWKQGHFAQDAVGDWWLSLPIAVPVEESVAPLEKVGIDLGLKEVAVTSDDARCEKGRFYRGIEQKIAQAQRRAHPRQAKYLHRRAANRRKDALHKFSRQLVDQYQKIAVGDVSSTQLVKTRMAKSVLDVGWGMLKGFLQYKSQQAGRTFQIVNERNSSRTCSNCDALTGPQGVNGLRVRRWTCATCGVSHDRDVNAARNILRRAEWPASVSGNESSSLPVPPSRASRSRKAGIEPVRTVA